MITGKTRTKKGKIRYIPSYKSWDYYILVSLPTLNSFSLLQYRHSQISKNRTKYTLSAGSLCVGREARGSRPVYPSRSSFHVFGNKFRTELVFGEGAGRRKGRDIRDQMRVGGVKRVKNYTY